MYDYRASSEIFVPFGPIARKMLGMQNQYASRYLKEPEFKDIRWRGGEVSYHDIEIHKDDVDKFVLRVTNQRRARGEIK